MGQVETALNIFNSVSCLIGSVSREPFRVFGIKVSHKYDVVFCSVFQRVFLEIIKMITGVRRAVAASNENGALL